MKKCAHCKHNTVNPKFCSRRCSVSSNNSQKPKRKLKRKCHVCETLVRSTRKFCGRCFTIGSKRYKTMDDAVRRYIKNGKAASFTIVRSRARAKLKREGRTACEVCGYNKFFEAAHRKALSSFPLETLIEIVNDSANIIALCPNHHWELDHGLLVLPSKH